METIKTILVTGYAKAPQGTSMYEIYKHAGIVLEIDFLEHKIVEVEFTFLAELTKSFFSKLVVGYDLTQGIDPLIGRIKEHYFAPSQQAVIVALQSAIQRYWDYTKHK
ncbi:DUF3870 domain-containing protein [Virgibacillus dakarensis]|nr:DUF3870 domain-containing protein [Virgibacillus dakarensis]